MYTVRAGFRIRWRVVTPPTPGSRKGLHNSARVSSVHSVSESTSTLISPALRFSAVRTALRLPAVSVHTHFAPNSSHTPWSTSLRGPLMQTMISPGFWSTIRRSTSRNRSGGSSTTGISTEVLTSNGRVHGR